MIELEAKKAGGFRADDEEEEEATEDTTGQGNLQARSAGEFLHPGSAARTASPGSGIYDTPRRSSAAGEPPGTPGSWRSNDPGTPGGLWTIAWTCDPSKESFAALRE